MQGYIGVIKGIISKERKDKTPNAFVKSTEQRTVN
jgi:hypothetical protein